MKYLMGGIFLLLISYMITITYMQLNYPNHFNSYRNYDQEKINEE